MLSKTYGLGFLYNYLCAKIIFQFKVWIDVPLFNLDCTSNNRISHTGSITRLRWQPGQDSLYLASSATDNCVKIFEVSLQ